MKLKQIQHKKDYEFLITFSNEEKINVDLKNLISSYGHLYVKNQSHKIH